MASEIRVMFVGHGPSGLPEDRVVNVFHFQGQGTYAEDVEDALSSIEGFYTGVQSGMGASLGSKLSPWVQRSAELRAYDMTTAPQRVPTVRPITLPNVAAQGAPEEVAICLSYSGDPPITPRRRGRIYFGPISNQAFESASSSEPARPMATMVADLILAATSLADLPGGLSWCVRSSLPTINYVKITRGYVDNALDTQRRRGPDTTARTSFLVAAV